jgi:hypothetical protein
MRRCCEVLRFAPRLALADVQRCRIEVDVDLDALIERVMIGPELSKDDMEAVIEQTKKAGLGDRICKSSLLGEPLYF